MAEPIMEKGRIFTGSRARFKLNGITVGYARNVNVSEEIRYDPIEILDNIEVQEFVPVAYMVRLRASKFRIVGASLKAAGYMPATGVSAEDHLNNIMLAEDMTATIEDTKHGSKATLATVTGVRVASNNWTVDARGVVGEDVDFVAIRSQDESEI